MKIIKPISVAAAALFLASCFGTKEHAMEVEPEPAKVAQKPASTKPKPRSRPKPVSRPDRPPPPPQPQDGSVIVKPGGATPAIPKVSKKDQDNALSNAKKEIAKRKSGGGDDPVSKALKDVEQKDIDRAFGELKKAAEKYSGE